MDDDNYIDDLYKSFVEAIESHDSLDEFSRDELIEIYDHASDIQDGFIRLKVLNEALSQYPGDQELLERQAYLHYDLGDITAARQALDAIPGESFLKSLLAIALGSNSKAVTIPALDNLLSAQQKDALDDEEVIRLVDIAHQLDLMEWLSDRYATIKQCAAYPDTVMNEISKTADETGHKDLAIKVLEDFTSEYPFNVEAWLCLSDLYLEHLQDPVQADQAIGYALAIDPSRYDTRIRQLGVKCHLDENPSEALELANSMLEDFPDNEAVILQKSLILLTSGREDEARATLMAAMERNPESSQIANAIIAIAKTTELPENVRSLVAREVATDAVYVWLTYFRDHYDNERTIPAAIIASLLIENGVFDRINYEKLIRLLEAEYRAGQFADVLRHIGLAAQSFPNLYSYPEMILLHALVLKRQGEIENLERLLEFCKGAPALQPNGDLQDRIKMVGIVYYLLQLRLSLTNPDVPESSYDPFVSDD